MGITVVKTTEPKDFEQVNPNFIYNRFDLFCEAGEFEAVKIQNGAETKVVEYKITGSKAEVGLWLTPVTAAEIKALMLYIKKMHPEVKKAVYKYGLLPYGKAKEGNHFKICFPDNADEMRARISSSSWHKMRRRNRRAAEAYGEMQLVEYTDGKIPTDVVETFFEYKKATRSREYNMTAEEYLKKYHVTDCYVVKFGDTMGAMHFCCEQCPVVNGENHAYNPELREYSLGKFIFAHSLIRIVEKEKGHTEILLGGGEYEYKTHYGSIEEKTYDCEVNLADVGFSLGAVKRKAKRFIKKLIKK